jgi:transcriptional regulator with XRE-family HTH domain
MPETAQSQNEKTLDTRDSSRIRMSPRQFLPSPKESSFTTARRKNQRGAPVSENNGNMNTMDLDREVIRCKVCGLVQYRTKTGNCRRCVRLLPPRLEFLIPPPAPPEAQAGEQTSSDKWPNRETVENIGQRIRQLRESRGMTQSQLQSRSRVSRSYLSRIESGQMTPSLGTLEKISEALTVGLNRFFIPESDGEALLEDPFIQGLRPFLRQLDWEQWQSILKRLQAISDNVSATPLNIRPIGNPARLPQTHAPQQQFARRPVPAGASVLSHR